LVIKNLLLYSPIRLQNRDIIGIAETGMIKDAGEINFKACDNINVYFNNNANLNFIICG